MDEGATWHRLAKLDSTDDLVIDHILVDRGDPATRYAAAWKFDRPEGGLWMSHDAGKSWHEAAGLHGQSIRAFAARPPIRTCCSRERCRECFARRTVERRGSSSVRRAARKFTRWNLWRSIRKDPNIIYAGTWHLPWKTTTAGHWANIKQGVIDDSDVFSIIIDPERSNIVYMSACSGIYKSADCRRDVQEDSGNSRHGPPNARAADGSGASRNGVRRNHRGPVQDHRCRPHLSAHDRTGRDCERCVHVTRAIRSRAAGHRSRRRAVQQGCCGVSLRARTAASPRAKVEALLVDAQDSSRCMPAW